MKIEIDTQRDSNDDLMHLANILNALSGSRRSGAVKPRDFVDKPKNVFEDSSPSGGLFNMFGDSSSPPSTPAEQQPSAAAPAQSGTGDLFSIFNSADSGSQPTETTTASMLLSSKEEPEQRSSAKEIMDGDRIVPY